MLLQALPGPFLVQFRDVECRGIIDDPAYLQNMRDALAQKQFERPQRSITLFCSFLDRSVEDLQNLERAAEATEKFIGQIARGRPDPALAEYCHANPPVFRASRALPEFSSLQPTKVPLFGCPAMGIAIEANGVREAVVRLILFRGESRTFLLVSPRLYRFSQAEFLLFGTLAKLVNAHPSLIEKSHFLSYPETYRIHTNLVAVDCRGAASMREIAEPHSVFRKLGATEWISDSVEVPRPDLPDDLLLNWAVHGAMGNRKNFIFARQSLASHYGALTLMEVVLGRTEWPTTPLLFGVDRQRVFWPGLSEGAGVSAPDRTGQEIFSRVCPPRIVRLRLVGNGGGSRWKCTESGSGARGATAGPGKIRGSNEENRKDGVGCFRRDG
jgi:hypothetical protein